MTTRQHAIANTKHDTRAYVLLTTNPDTGATQIELINTTTQPPKDSK